MFKSNITHSDILPEVKVFEPKPFHDYRGEMWTFWESIYDTPKEKISKFTRSRKDVLRGLHGDDDSWKLMSCVYGEVYFVVVNPEKTHWDWTILSNKNKKQVLVPPKYTNGIYVLSDECVLHYKYSYPNEYQDIEKQYVVKWDDKDLNIHWPIEEPILQQRDRS